jgi:hypothetical protein
MTVTDTEGRIEITADHSDTWHFAQYNPAGSWPASDLAGRDVRLVLAPNGDLIDASGTSDALSEEVGAFIAYALSANGYAPAAISHYAH